MFARAEWQTMAGATSSEGRVRVSKGIVRCFLRVERGKGWLNLYFDPRDTEEYISPSNCTSIGVLGLARDDLPAMQGSHTTLSISAISREIVNAAEKVLEFFGSLGLTANIRNRTLDVQSDCGPEEIIPMVGLALLALDIQTRRALSDRAMEDIRFSVVKSFGEAAEEVLRFFDEHDGEWRVKELLGTALNREKRRTREASILSAIQRLKPERIVHFHCGIASLLRRIFESVPHSCDIVGIEPSLVRVERVAGRLAGLCSVRHGSVLEPPSDLTGNGLALIVDGLPRSGDTRVARAARTLCNELGFKWILAVQDEATADRGKEFASHGSKFSYRAGGWTIGGRDSAVLLKRSTDVSVRTNHTVPNAVRVIETRLLSKPIRLQQEQWAATLEAFSLRTVDPKWLIYLPSAIASIQNDRGDGLLEHPSDAFDYYGIQGVHRLVVETKHMGSRAVAIVCKDLAAAEARFGKRELGCIYTRNGRPFFDEREEFLSQLHSGLTRAKFWDRFQTDWVCLDGEILPWSVKAQRLMSDSHRESLDAAVSVVEEMEHAFVPTLREAASAKREVLGRYRRLLEKYETEIGTPISFAPFHLIATEGKSYFDKGHDWHIRTLNGLARRAGPPFTATRYELLNIRSNEACARVTKWWDEISESGEEGLVVKPLHFICRGRRGWAQPAIKCRGKEHLRLVYGPDYDEPENRLRLLDRRALARRRQKHRRILRQFALSIEAVERFVRKEELSRVEECVRGVLSLETREIFPEERSL